LVEIAIIYFNNTEVVQDLHLLILWGCHLVESDESLSPAQRTETQNFQTNEISA